MTTLLLVLATTPTASIPAAADDWELEAELESTQEELEATRASLAGLGDDITAATADLRRIDQQLAEMYGDLAEREAELAAAEEELALAEARTRAADERVAEVSTSLVEAELASEESQARFEGRVVALWKFGTVGYSRAVLESGDVSEAITQAYYVQRVLDSDKHLVDTVRDDRDRISERRSELDNARDGLRLEQSAVASAVADVEVIARVHRDLVSAVEKEQKRRRGVVDSLRLTEQRYKNSIAALQAESEKIKKELAASRFAAGRPGTGELVWPTSGSPGSGYGYRTHPISGQRRMHAGIDIGAPTGQKIVAAADGRVVSAGWRGGYGLAVVIDHGGGLATLSAHQSRLAVRAGEIVAQGQTIGYVGSTGYSTGPHLHFEVRIDGEPVDPMKWY